MTVKVGIADDHDIVRFGLKAFLERQNLDVLFDAESGAELLELIKKTPVDILVTDFDMGDMNGADITREVKSLFPDIKVIIFTMFQDGTHLQTCMDAGADGYVIKSDYNTTIMQAIENVQNDRYYFSQKVSLENGVLARVHLTGREREIIKLIADGKSSNDIGQIFEISPKTVDKHKSNIYKKIGVNSSAALVRVAIENGLI